MSRNRSDWLSAVRDDDFHPELRRIARVLPRGPVGPRTLPLIRVLTGLGLPRRRDDVEVLTLPTGGAIRLFRPTGQSGLGAALLWIHGGGYVVGRACQDDMLCRRFGLALGITVASVEYRLAPEHPYPAGLEDCYRALARLASLPDVDPARIAVGGASAGSGLAAALNQLARDRGEINPAFQLLSYPMLDDRTADGGPFQRQYRTWNQRSNRFGWQSYLGAAGPDIAVPARRDDLTRLAPAWIGVGTLDLFYEEDVAYAKRLNEAGVHCQLEVVPGAFHGFDRWAPRAAVSKAFFDSQCTNLGAGLALQG